MKQEVLQRFLEAWNKRNVDECIIFLDEDVELHSSYALKIFPESRGVIQGKVQVVPYVELLFTGFHDIEVIDPIITEGENCLVVKAGNDSNTLNYYLQYYINDQNLIYLIKSNMTKTI